jgi:predicted  nucleic acid-binding Zn-ribbon protein
MSAHVSVRTFVLAAAVAWLFAASHAIAQTPPAAADAEKRLRALEDKMDRVLKLMEARTAPLPAKGTAASAVEAARDKVKAELQAKEEQVPKWPFPPANGAWNNVFAERLGKIESRRSELRIKMLEMADQLGRIEKAYKENNKAALFVIKAMGIKITGLDENPANGIIRSLDRERQKLVTNRGEKHPSVADVENVIALVRKIYAGREGTDVQDYIKMMKEEVADLGTRIETLTSLIDSETKTMREMNHYQAAEDRIRREIDGLRNTLKVLDSLLIADESQKPK